MKDLPFVQSVGAVLCLTWALVIVFRWARAALGDRTRTSSAGPGSHGLASALVAAGAGALMLACSVAWTRERDALAAAVQGREACTAVLEQAMQIRRSAESKAVYEYRRAQLATWRASQFAAQIPGPSRKGLVDRESLLGESFADPPRDILDPLVPLRPDIFSRTGSLDTPEAPLAVAGPAGTR